MHTSKDGILVDVVVARKDNTYYNLVYFINIVYLHYQVADTFLVSQVQLQELESQATVESLQVDPNDTMTQVFGTDRHGMVQRMGFQTTPFNVFRVGPSSKMPSRIVEILRRSEKSQRVLRASRILQYASLRAEESSDEYR